MTLTAVSAPLTVTLTAPSGPFRRADLEFHGIDHSRSSFSVRVFLDRPGADVTTPPDEANGFAGTFHILGHGGCAGDEGHCDVPDERRAADLRPAHQLVRLSKRLVVTGPLRRALADGRRSVRVTLVAVLRSELAEGYGEALTTDLLTCERVDLLTYQ